MTSEGTTRRLALLGVVLALALPALLMACGGDSPDAGGDRAATHATKTTETASTPAREVAASTPMPANAPTATDAPRATVTSAPLLTIGRTSAETDREALVALYNATGGESWNESDNWLSNAAMDEWTGVVTDGNGRVIYLRLDSNQLSGEIPPELGDHPKLVLLGFYGNRLSGCVPQSLEGRITDMGGRPFCGE